MKILHLGDLHLGKRVNEISMIEDQKFILDQNRYISKRRKDRCYFIMWGYL